MFQRSYIKQRGQALVELVLASLMFLPLFLLIYQSTRLVYARLALISLTRDAALYMIHEEKIELSTDVLAELAKRRHLNPAQVSSEVASATLGKQAGSMPVLGAMVKFLMGSRLTLHYHFEFKGPLGLLQPEGLNLTESVVLQSNCWKNLGVGLLKEMFSF